MHPMNLAYHSHFTFSFHGLPPYSTGTRTCIPGHPGLFCPVTLVESFPQLHCFHLLQPPQLTYGHIAWLSSEWRKPLSISRSGQDSWITTPGLLIAVGPHDLLDLQGVAL